MTGSRHVALYGGSFNPPHVCHVLVATWVLCRGDVHEMRLIPVHNHAFGKALAPFDARCQMLRLAFSHLGPAVTVSRIEEELGHATSYTIDTVQALLEMEPDIGKLSFVCGADVYAQRRRWKRWETLETLLDFIVIGRQGAPALSDDEGEPIIPRVTLPDMSSSALRAAIASGKRLPGWLPTAVEAFIEKEGLYR